MKISKPVSKLGTMKLTVPVNRLKDKTNMAKKIVDKLKSDRNNSYSIGGLMVTAMGVPENKIRQGFGTWDAGLPTMYGRINFILKKLMKKGFVKRVKDGKAWMFYWVGNDHKRVDFSIF